MTRYLLTPVSGNSKTGPIPVSITSGDTCPDACPLRGAGCYAEGGRLGMAWRRVERGEGRAAGLGAFLAAVRALPDGQLWRHNQAGDLPGAGDSIDNWALRKLTEANNGKRGFTYTHKPVGPYSALEISNALAVERANRSGFTVNLSADSLREADELAALGIGPVVVTLPADAPDAPSLTPAGRTVVVCPAQTAKGEARGVTCESCGLCAVAARRSVVGFKAHGFRKGTLNKRLLVIS